MSAVSDHHAIRGSKLHLVRFPRAFSYTGNASLQAVANTGFEPVASSFQGTPSSQTDLIR